jgi:hypothetical protein
MKIKNIIAVAFALLTATLAASAQDAPKPYVGSVEFEKIKSLAGTWTGTMTMGKDPMPITAQYRVISGGSAVEERLFTDTPMEMVTIYHDEQGKLALTHYCMLCNRPAMRLVKSSAKSLSFDLKKNSGIDVKTEKHMHSLTLTFDDANNITHDWLLWDGGKPQPHNAFKLARKQ